jgi:hypothetical protein
MKVFVLAIILPIFFARAFATDISLNVQAKPQVLRLGDRVVFTITYRNTSHRDIGIITEGHVYEAADVDLIKSDSKEKGQVVTYLTLEYDFKGAAKAFRVLRQGQTYERRVVAKISSSLSSAVASNAQPGRLYLIFSNSAIRLPAFGTYLVTAEYAVTGYLKHFLEDNDRNRLWVGKVSAPRIPIEIRQRQTQSEHAGAKR